MARGRPATPLGTHGEVTGPKITKSGKYRYYTLLRLYNGKSVQVQATARSKTAARRLLEENCQTRLGGTDGESLNVTSTLARLLGEWLPRHDVSESTKTTYSKCIRLHIKPALGGVRLNELDTFKIQVFLDTLTPGTAKTARAILGAAIGLAVRWGVMSVNPVRDTSLPRARKNEVRTLTDEEMDAYRARLVEWCGGNKRGPGRGEGLVEIMDVVRGSGMRIGEVLALRWQDVDLEAGTATVAGTADDKGGRSDFPKTEKSRRTIPLAPVALEALRRQRLKPYVEYTGEPVFPTRTGGYRTVNNTETRLRKARGDMDIRPHDFRKTVATRIEARYGLLAASRYLGHASTTVTEQAYLGRPAVVENYTDAFSGQRKAR